MPRPSRLLPAAALALLLLRCDAAAPDDYADLKLGTFRMEVLGVTAEGEAVLFPFDDSPAVPAKIFLYGGIDTFIMRSNSFVRPSPGDTVIPSVNFRLLVVTLVR